MLKKLLYVTICSGIVIVLALTGYSRTVRNTNSSFNQSPRLSLASLFGEDTIRTVFVGDIMLDRGVARSAAKTGKENIFAGVQHIFQGADAVIGNMEGTVSSRPSIAIPGSSVLRFTFDPSFIPLLRAVGFTAFSLANNHSLDFGHAAYKETRDYVHASNMLTFGSALNTGDLSVAIPIKDGAFCLVGYHDLFVADPSGALTEISTIRPNCSHVVVFVHWGSEYTHVPSGRQRVLAQGFIDAGADLIIGAHPHVVQPVEIYNGKAIFYSLGNFVFDQNFSFATMHGLAVNVEWGSERTRFELIPIAISKGQVTVAEGEARTAVLKTVVGENTPKNVASSVRAAGEFTLEVEGNRESQPR
jgi:gamma-polyglutamate biosynthesis protein CapA